MKKEVSYKITLLNFLFTISMVLYHFRWSDPFSIKYINEYDEFIAVNYIKACDKVGFIAMTFFFLVSAFLFYFNLNTSKDALIKMKKRIKTLLIPYLLWSIIVIIYKIIIGENIKFSLNSIISMFFLDPINGPTWYLLALIILMVPSFLIIKLKGKKILSFIIMIISLLLIELRFFGYINPIFSFNNWWWYGNIISYLPAYIVGIFLGINYGDNIITESYNTKITKYLGMVLIILSTSFLMRFSNWAIVIMAYICLIIGIWFILNIKNVNDKLLGIFKVSFFMYAMHGQILIPEINRLYTFIFNNIQINGYIFILAKIIGLILMITVCYILIKFLSKLKNQKILFYLSGGRV